MSAPRIRLLAAVIAGLAVSFFLVTPASAQDDVRVRAINDGEIACSPAGDVLVPWHIDASIPVIVTNLQSTPAGTFLFPDGQSSPWDQTALLVQVLPAGSTDASLSFTWTSAADPQVTGTAVGDTSQAVPACGQATVSAAFTAKCDRLVDVNLTNGYKYNVVFLVNGTEYPVAVGASHLVTDVPANDEDGVEVSVEGGWAMMPLDSFTWTEPAGCVPPGSSLAATGSDVGGIVGIGGALLAVGAMLVAFTVLRRRRPTAN